MIQIVGLVGETESGKDTIADIAIEKFDARRIAFADPIRNCALAIDPIIPVVIAGDEPVEPGKEQIQLARLTDVVTQLGWRDSKKLPEVRRILQRIGTEMGREIIHEDLWINLGFRLMMAYANGSGGELNKFVITDVRFPSEAEGMMKLAETIGAKAVLVRVRRPGFGPINDHASENSYDVIETTDTIDNDGTLEDLAVKVEEVLGKVFV